jgi:LysM repeat protein
MDKSMHREMKDMMKGIAEDLGYSRKERDLKSYKKPIIVGSVGIFILMLIFVWFVKDHRADSEENMSSSQATPDQLEKKLSQVHRLEEKIARLEKEHGVIQQSLGEAVRLKKALSQEIDKIAKKLPSPTARGKTLLASEKKALRGSKSYHEVRSGDSLYKIAEEYAISVRELCRLNNLTENHVIRPGEKLLIAPGSRH